MKKGLIIMMVLLTGVSAWADADRKSWERFVQYLADTVHSK